MAPTCSRECCRASHLCLPLLTPARAASVYRQNCSMLWCRGCPSRAPMPQTAPNKDSRPRLQSIRPFWEAMSATPAPPAPPRLTQLTRAAHPTSTHTCATAGWRLTSSRGHFPLCHSAWPSPTHCWLMTTRCNHPNCIFLSPTSSLALHEPQRHQQWNRRGQRERSASKASLPTARTHMLPPDAPCLTTSVMSLVGCRLCLYRTGSLFAAGSVDCTHRRCYRAVTSHAAPCDIAYELTVPG